MVQKFYLEQNGRYWNNNTGCYGTKEQCVAMTLNEIVSMDCFANPNPRFTDDVRLVDALDEKEKFPDGPFSGSLGAYLQQASYSIGARAPAVINTEWHFWRKMKFRIGLYTHVLVKESRVGRRRKITHSGAVSARFQHAWCRYLYGRRQNDNENTAYPNKVSEERVRTKDRRDGFGIPPGIARAFLEVPGIKVRGRDRRSDSPWCAPPFPRVEVLATAGCVPITVSYVTDEVSFHLLPNEQLVRCKNLYFRKRAGGYGYTFLAKHGTWPTETAFSNQETPAK